MMVILSMLDRKMITNGRIISYTIYFALCGAYFFTGSYLFNQSVSSIFGLRNYLVFPVSFLILSDIIFSVLYWKLRSFDLTDRGFIKCIFEGHPLGKRFFVMLNITLVGCSTILLGSVPHSELSAYARVFWPIIFIGFLFLIFVSEFIIISFFRTVSYLRKN